VAGFASDFRSDTVTRPTPAMRRAMAEAEVGDDVLDGDPTVGRLEARAAEWLGKDGALFVPSGTMANQVALGVWGRPGDEVILEREAHVLRWEAGAMSALHGLQSVVLAGRRGALDAGEVAALIRPDFVHCPRTALVCVEQTHMDAGGAVVPLAALEEVRRVTGERGVRVHMDGARLPHAQVASGVPAARYAACADSVSVCLSKGLGAPVGSIVAGSAEFVARARVVRKRLGGWMRQAGIVAAGGLVALEHGLARLEEDHRLARELAGSLHGRFGLACPPESVETNIAQVAVERDDLDAPELARRLGAEGVGVMALRPRVLRFVTHRDVGPDDVARALRAFEHIG